MHTGRDQNLREEKGVGGTEKRGAGSAGPRTAQAGLKDRESRGSGQRGLIWKCVGDREGTSKGNSIFSPGVEIE